MTKWTKKSAISRMNSNPLLQEVLQIEPRLKPIIEEAKRQRNVRGYDRIKKHIELRNRAIQLVGWDAENEQLRSSKFYDVVVKTIDDLLPPDHVDLDPDGIREL
jgi:hypothetical protein